MSPIHFATCECKIVLYVLLGFFKGYRMGGESHSQQKSQDDCDPDHTKNEQCKGINISIGQDVKLHQTNNAEKLQPLNKNVVTSSKDKAVKGEDTEVWIQLASTIQFIQSQIFIAIASKFIWFCRILIFVSQTVASSSINAYVYPSVSPFVHPSVPALVNTFHHWLPCYCPACRTYEIATRF